MARQRKLRQRLLIGLAVVCVLGLAGGLAAALAGGSTPTAAKSKASASPTASALRLRHQLDRRRTRHPLRLHHQRGGEGGQDGFAAAGFT